MSTGIRKAKRQAGCGFLMLTCVFTCFLLVVNSALMIVIYRALVSSGPEWLHEEEVAQAILFAGPLVLVFVEWAIIDWLIELSSPAGKRDDKVTEKENEA